MNEEITFTVNSNRRMLKTRVAASFGLKVARYEKNAVIQGKLLDKLVLQLLHYSSPGESWADFGCGNGGLEKKLSDLGWQGRMTGIDIAFRSLHFCKKQIPVAANWVCGDAELPPFKRPVFNGIVAASMLQWTDHPETTVTTLASLLQPGGLFIFSLFTEGSFHQLVEIRKRFNLSIPAVFPGEAQVNNLLHRLHMVPLSTAPYSETVLFSSANELLRHLSAVGSTGSSEHPLSRSRLRQFCSDLENAFGASDGVPLTYNALFGTARKGDG